MDALVIYRTAALTTPPTTTTLAKVRLAVFPDWSSLMVWSYAAMATAVPNTILAARITLGFIPCTKENIKDNFYVVSMVSVVVYVASIRVDDLLLLDIALKHP